MVSSGAGKGGVAAVGHFGGNGGFFQQVQHAVRAGKHLHQVGGQVGQRHHRAKGPQRRQRADQHGFPADCTVPAQHKRGAQHSQGGKQDDGVGHGRGRGPRGTSWPSAFRQGFAVGSNPGGAGGGIVILDGLPQAAQAFQHIAVGIGQGGAVFAARGFAALRPNRGCQRPQPGSPPAAQGPAADGTTPQPTIPALHSTAIHTGEMVWA